MNTKSKIILITYETNFNRNNITKGSIKSWFKSVNKYKWKHYALGQNEIFKGYGQKILSLKKILPKIIKNIGPNTIVIFTDSRDVIANRNNKDFSKIFNKIRKSKPIVFSTEVGCCVNQMTYKKPGTYVNSKKGKIKSAIIKNKNMKTTNNYTNKWVNKMGVNRKLHKHIKFYWMRALNSGMYCGFAKDLYKLIKKISPINKRENNQALYSNAMIAFPKMVTLDYNNMLFSNANTWDGYKKGCFFAYDKNRKMWKNKITKTYPYFIQVPGMHINDYKCYNKIISKL